MSEVMNKARVESFSDAVIAVAITLLILDIAVPSKRSPGRWHVPWRSNGPATPRMSCRS